jgi:hypothetical protein
MRCQLFSHTYHISHLSPSVSYLSTYLPVYTSNNLLFVSKEIILINKGMQTTRASEHTHMRVIVLIFRVHRQLRLPEL